MDSKSGLLDIIFSNGQKKTTKSKKRIPGNIQGDIYIPERPYNLEKGIGEFKMFKGKTFEWLIIHSYGRFVSLKNWSEKTLRPGVLYREHIIWVYEAFQELPRPQCIMSNCSKGATHFSTRTSADGQISFGFPYLACEDHLEELRGVEDRISINPLLPSSLKEFHSNNDRKIFLVFLKNCFNFKDLSGQQIFKTLKKFLPTIMIKPHPVDIKEIKDKKQKKVNKINPDQYQLAL